MSETLYDGFEKMGKKQNKEQVPPAAESENKKPSSSKQSKKTPSSNTVTSPTHKSLEEAFKAVSIGHTSQFSIFLKLLGCLDIWSVKFVVQVIFLAASYEKRKILGLF